MLHRCLQLSLICAAQIRDPILLSLRLLFPPCASRLGPSCPAYSIQSLARTGDQDCIYAGAADGAQGPEHSRVKYFETQSC